MLDAAIVGGGVIGLTTAISLSRRGFRAEVFTKDPSLVTTSANSGAIWGPFLSDIDDRLRRWSYETLEVLKTLAESDPESGVELVSGIGVEGPGIDGRWWVQDLHWSEDCHASELGGNYVRGWRYQTPIIDMPRYLGYLLATLEDLAVPVHVENIGSVDDLIPIAGHVIVCAGIGSASLTQDGLLVGSKGQLVVVRNPGIETFFAERGDGPDLTYILPQGDKVILGGTAEWGFTNKDAEEAATKGILARCSKIEPRLEQADILGIRVGVRPCRNSVRVEHSADAHVIYNYGHGGSGVSVAWGSAAEVVRIVESCAAPAA